MSVLQSVRDHVRGYLDVGDPQEASVTFLGAEPMRILRFVGPGDLVRYATLGCSAAPMGDPEEIVPDPDGPRAELVMHLRGGVDGVARTLAVLGAAPEVDGLVLRPDALIDLGEPLWPGSSFTGVVLQEADIPELPLADAAPVTFLRAIPVTHNEAAWVRLKGAGELVAAWDEAGIDTADPDRSAVNL